MTAMVEYGSAVGGAGGGGTGGIGPGIHGVGPSIGGLADSVGSTLNGLLHGAIGATSGVSPVVLALGLVLVVFGVAFLRRAL